MDNNVLVSVVIPAYNAENFISGCLHATTHQTYPNIEIIIVDDGSQDSTRKTCEEYAEGDDRIRLFSIQNSGASFARNYGIEKATGDYIVFFDADDRPERDLIENYLQAMKEWEHKKVAFIACGMFYDNMLNRNATDSVAVLEPNYGFVSGENYLLKRCYASTLAWLKLFNFVTNKFYDLKKIKENGIRFDTGINVGEDLNFNLDYLDKVSGYIGMVNRPLYHYIKRSSDSLSLTYHESDLEDTKAIYSRFLNWELKQDGVRDDNILVLQSIFITDWISRLTTIRDAWESDKKLRGSIRSLDKEISSDKFQETLKKVRKAKKISYIRYLSLRTGNFGVFCFIRKIYQLVKA